MIIPIARDFPRAAVKAPVPQDVFAAVRAFYPYYIELGTLELIFSFIFLMLEVNLGSAAFIVDILAVKLNLCAQLQIIVASFFLARIGQGVGGASVGQRQL